MRKITILAVIALLLPVASAHATPVLTLTSGSSTVTIQDGGLGDGSTAAGVVMFSGSVGSWFLNVTTGATKPTLSMGQMDLNSISMSQATHDPLVISFTETDFVMSDNTGANLRIGGTTAGSVSYAAYYDPNNGLNPTTLIASTQPLTGAFAATDWGYLALNGPFSMRQVITITHPTSPAGQTFSSSFNADLTAVPEPGSMLLLGTSLLGVTAVLRRRMKK